jgi:penicillin-binding protein 2
LFGENIGLVPDNLWKQKTKNERWYTGDTYHVSIGQGDLLVTPLQLAAATAALLNGGKVISPHLVDKIVDSDKNTIETYEPKVLQQGFIDGNNLAIIKEGMRQTVTVGSALLLNNLPVKAGAKTGTAQVAGQRNPNAWVTVFAPYDNPEMVLVILIENAGEGSEVAVPVAYDVLREYFKK